MKLNHYFLLLLFVIPFGLIGFSIPSDSNPDQTYRYIIKLKAEKSSIVEHGLVNQLAIKEDQIELESIFPSLSLFSLKFYSELPVTQIEKTLSQLPGLVSYHKDVKTNLRATIPNDIDYSEQWNLELISAPQAWDKTTGGKTNTGHDIVVAIIDNGFDTKHEDLIENIWTNEAEIPDNGIDDDDNGYVDDYRGANTVEENGNLPSRTHGTAVAGIIGAKGNNRSGITGINWDVKMMLIAGQGFVSEIIESYNYALTQRRLFNESNGEEGALVVATNFSSGINEVFAAEYPLWCSVYDELGAVGILNVTAAPNNPKDIDEVGDMPSTCPSEYLIVVNNIDRNEDLASDSGFGETHVDIAAPGDEAFSLSIQNTYKEFSGTSSSTPHVAGSIGLMYSVPNTDLGSQSIARPAQTAIAVKNALLKGATEKDALAEKNSTNARLNLSSAIDEIEQQFNSDNNFGLTIFPNPAGERGFTLTYLVDELTTHQLEIHDAMGRLVYSEKFVATTFEPYVKEMPLTENFYQGIYYLSIRTDSKVSTKPFLFL